MLSSWQVKNNLMSNCAETCTLKWCSVRSFMWKIRLLHRCENAAHYYYVVPTRTEPEQSTVLMLCLYHRQNVKCKVCRSRDEYKLMALMLSFYFPLKRPLTPNPKHKCRTQFTLWVQQQGAVCTQGVQTVVGLKLVWLVWHQILTGPKDFSIHGIKSFFFSLFFVCRL